MSDFYDSTEYQKYLAAKNELAKCTSAIKRVFRLDTFFINVKLTECNPCNFCDNMKHLRRGSGIDSEAIDQQQCETCVDKVMWKAHCMSKLSHYENGKLGGD